MLPSNEGPDTTNSPLWEDRALVEAGQVGPKTSCTPWNKQFAPENRPFQKETIVFQPSIFKGVVGGYKWSYFPRK